MGVLNRTKQRFAIFREFWYFMKYQKAWWLTPIILVLLGLGLLVVFTSSSPLAPFIYTIF